MQRQLCCLSVMILLVIRVALALDPPAAHLGGSPVTPDPTKFNIKYDITEPVTFMVPQGTWGEGTRMLIVLHNSREGAHALTWPEGYSAAAGIPLPTTTPADTSTYLYLLFAYNAHAQTWVLIATTGGVAVPPDTGTPAAAPPAHQTR
jgi:hypothetical protein